MVYYDRNGDEFTPKESDTIRSREGAFCVCICGNKILVNVEDHAPDNPSLPGGGIDEGETPLQAAKREFLEETGMAFPTNLAPIKTFVQDIKLYADDVDEYWDYNQTYFLFNIPEDSEIVFTQRRINPSGYYAFWDDVSGILQSNLHNENKRALKQILDITE